MILHDPDGQPIEIDPRDFVHCTDQIKYTTVIIKDGKYTKRFATVEPIEDVREAISQGMKEHTQ